MKKAPLILVVPGTQPRGAEFADYSLSLSNRYLEALIAAGGVPWVMPVKPQREFAAECVRRCDGVMLTGGDDVEPKLYRRRTPARLRRKVKGLEPHRDLLELMLIDEVFAQRKPLLAICRGHQMLNVALGGTLLVDIAAQMPKALDHSRSDLKDRVVHEVALTPGSLLSRIFHNQKVGVNSSHHQAVARVAPPLEVSARSPDGIVEGLELKPGAARMLPFLLSVQFHPERMIGRHPEFLEMFGRFTRACAPQIK